MKYPRGGESKIVKNGSLTNGKSKYKCKSCARQLVENLRKGAISEETKELIDKRLLERLPLAAITGVSEQWLQSYVNKKYEEVQKKVKDVYIVECDEVWSYVGNKDNKQAIWLAIDQDTGEIVGVAIGDRSHYDRGAIMEFVAGNLSPVQCLEFVERCRELYRFLGCVFNDFTEWSPSGCRQGNWENESYFDKLSTGDKLSICFDLKLNQQVNYFANFIVFK